MDLLIIYTDGEKITITRDEWHSLACSRRGIAVTLPNE